MTDLTKLTSPFGLLDKETQDALKAHGGPYEAYSEHGWVGLPPNWFNGTAYRVKPSPVVETRTGAAWCEQYGNDSPILWDDPSGYHPKGTYTLTLHDGKPVKLVWEAE